MEFGAEPVSGLGIYINPLGTTDAIDVRFKRLDIRADRLVRLEEPTGLGRPSALWWTVSAAAGGFGHHRAGLAPIRRPRPRAGGARRARRSPASP